VPEKVYESEKGGGWAEKEVLFSARRIQRLPWPLPVISTIFAGLLTSFPVLSCATRLFGFMSSAGKLIGAGIIGGGTSTPTGATGVFT